MAIYNGTKSWKTPTGSKLKRYCTRQTVGGWDWWLQLLFPGAFRQRPKIIKSKILDFDPNICSNI
jgi:hypothetical protein